MHYQYYFFSDVETSDVQLQLIAMTPSIQFYGISDLKEILDMITQGGNTLAKCRSLKTTNYLQVLLVYLFCQIVFHNIIFSFYSHSMKETC